MLADTSAIYALLDRADANHARADTTFASLVRTETLVTHNYVVVESVALVQRRLGVDAVRQLFDDILAPFDLLWIDERIHRSATAAMIAVESQKISFVDWTSFEIMRQHGIDRAFAFDDDFVKQGFLLVP